MMENYRVSKHSHFYLIGIDHEKAPVEIREGFSLTEEKALALAAAYRAEGGDGLLVLSTCNRSEIYAFAECPRDLMHLFCRIAGQDLATLERHQKVLRNRAAIEHLFRVGSGLESKILGDFEIIGQVKKAYRQSKAAGTHNAFLDRLVNAAVRCSKKVKNETSLSTGAASVAFAAVLQVKDYLSRFRGSDPRVLLLGLGKMGQTTAENLLNQTGLRQVTLINRTEKKAEALADRLGLAYRNLADLPEEAEAADIVIVATGAETATLKREHFKSTRGRMILDLSMPRNVEQSLYRDPDFQVVDVDHLSDVAQESIARRRSQVPAAEALIEEQIEEFYLWLESRKVAPTLQALKAKMDEWKQLELSQAQKKFPSLPAQEAEAFAEQILNRITGQLARQLKQAEDLNGELRTIQHIFGL